MYGFKQGPLYLTITFKQQEKKYHIQNRQGKRHSVTLSNTEQARQESPPCPKVGETPAPTLSHPFGSQLAAWATGHYPGASSLKPHHLQGGARDNPRSQPLATKPKGCSCWIPHILTGTCLRCSPDQFHICTTLPN